MKAQTLDDDHISVKSTKSERVHSRGFFSSWGKVVAAPSNSSAVTPTNHSQSKNDHDLSGDYSDRFQSNFQLTISHDTNNDSGMNPGLIIECNPDPFENLRAAHQS